MWCRIKKTCRRTLWYSITQFVYTGGLWADSGQPEMKAAADVLIWWLLPWQQDEDWGGARREREWRENYLSHTPLLTPVSLSLSLIHPLSFTNTRPPLHQPTSGPRRFSYGSVSCRGPSLGQRGGVQNSDSLSGKQASMANNETAIKEREQHRIVPLRRGTCWRHHSSSASVHGQTGGSMKAVFSGSWCIYGINCG